MSTNIKDIPTLRFKDFSAQWQLRELKDFTKINQGLQIAISERFTENVEDSYFYITNEFLRKGAKKNYFIKNPPQSVICNENDLLMTRTGNTGQVVTGVQGAFHNNFFRIKFDSTCEKWFLYYFLTSHRTQHTILKLAGTSTIPDLNHGDFYKIKINIPEFREQQKIATFLSAIDEKIQQLTRKKELLEQYKKGVMQQLFSGKLRFKPENGKTYPKWEEKRLGDVCDCMDNLRKPLNDSQRQAMQGTIPYWGANKVMDYVNDYLFDETLVLLAEDGGNFNEYETRPIANLSRGKCWVNNHTHVLKGKKNLSNEFLFYSLVHKNITGFVSGGTRAKLNKSEMLKIPIGYPLYEEQQKIANYLSSLDTKIESVATQITKSQTFKKGLLQQMFV